jgi:hypothetical protein
LDVAPTLAVRALHEAGMYYDLYLVDMARKPQFDELGIPVTGSMDDLLTGYTTAPAKVASGKRLPLERRGNNADARLKRNATRSAARDGTASGEIVSGCL